MNPDLIEEISTVSLIGEAVPHRGEQLTEPVLVYHSAIIIIKAAKCVLDHILWVSAL